jgi:DNA-binding MarR family transcriptional regulator
MSKHHAKYHTKAETKRSEMAVLSVLEGKIKENGLMITEISKMLKLPPSAITPVINNLEERHLIIRKNSPGDRRIVLVELTDTGHEFYNKKQEFFFRKSVQLCNYLGEEDAQEFVRLFKKASEFMNDYPDDEDCDNNIHPENYTGPDKIL